MHFEHCRVTWTTPPYWSADTARSHCPCLLLGWLCHSLKVKQTQQSRLGSSPGLTVVNLPPVSQLYMDRVGGEPPGAFAFLRPPMTKVKTRYKTVVSCLVTHSELIFTHPHWLWRRDHKVEFDEASLLVSSRPG